jgi:hypothetical protein
MKNIWTGATDAQMIGKSWIFMQILNLVFLRTERLKKLKLNEETLLTKPGFLCICGEISSAKVRIIRKVIWNIQSKVFAVILDGWAQSLLTFHLFDYYINDTNSRKYPHSNYTEYYIFDTSYIFLCLANFLRVCTFQFPTNAPTSVVKRRVLTQCEQLELSEKHVFLDDVPGSRKFWILNIFNKKSYTAAQI